MQIGFLIDYMEKVKSSLEVFETLEVFENTDEDIQRRGYLLRMHISSFFPRAFENSDHRRDFPHPSSGIHGRGLYRPQRTADCPFLPR